MVRSAVVVGKGGVWLTYLKGGSCNSNGRGILEAVVHYYYLVMAL
jgi:hypothetical protein